MKIRDAFAKKGIPFWVESPTNQQFVILNEKQQEVAWNMNYTFEKLRDIIECFDPCMDNYLYVYDIIQDLYFISERAQKRFALSSNCFTNAVEEHRKFVYSEDYDALKVELEEVDRGERDRHNMQYRWLNKECVPVWINCRGKVLRESDGRPHFFNWQH